MVESEFHNNPLDLLHFQILKNYEQHCENQLHKDHKRDNNNWLYSYDSSILKKLSEITKF